MRTQREHQIVRVYATTVVTDANQCHAPLLDLDFDPRRARIQTVLQQLFDDRCRALDHLAGGDLVDKLRGKLVYAHASGTIGGRPPLYRPLLSWS